MKHHNVKKSKLEIILLFIAALGSLVSSVAWGYKTFFIDSIIRDEAQVLEFWRRPHPSDKGYEFKYPMTEYQSGFHVEVANSSQDKCHGLQIISNRFPDISEGTYVMKFEANVNNPFELCSRLGLDNLEGQPNLFEDSWPLKASPSWEEISTKKEFTVTSSDVKSKRNFLYFQVGKAKSGTDIKIRNIIFEKKEGPISNTIH